MNSVNHSFKSFDSCGRAFIMVLCLCVKPLSQKSVFIFKMILLFFQVLGYLMVCSSRISGKKEKNFFSKLLKSK